MTKNLLVAVCFSAIAQASPLPVAKPEQVGLSSERLKRIHELIERYREHGDLAGAVTVVARRGKLVHFEAQGFSDLEERKRMRTDDLMRIASMTKPIATVGALMLLEEQRFLLEDPVSKYLPEFHDMKVAVVQEAAPGYRLVPAEREITIHDLFSHRSGLRAGGWPAVSGTTAGPRSPANTLAEFSRNLASKPLLFQPGSAWQYGPSTDLLGDLVETLSGQPTRAIFARADFRSARYERYPFSSAPGKAGAASFRVPEETRRRSGENNFAFERVGAALRFGQRRLGFHRRGLRPLLPNVLNGGELDGRRYLSRKTIELMTARSWPAIPLSFLRGQYFGLGVAVKDDSSESGLFGSPGAYGWSGAYNTYFRVDPKEQLILVLFVQTSPANDIGLQYGFHNAVMQTIAD